MKKIIVMVVLLASFATTAVNGASKSAEKWKAQHVLLIGLDGWGPTVCPKPTTYLTSVV